MRFLGLAVAVCFPLSVLGSAQVNFYYDTECKNYAGHNFAQLDGGSVGGPYGSRSMLFVNSGDDCFDTCGPNLKFCKNQACSAYDLASKLGECKSFRNGVWAAEDCGCGE